MKTLTILLSVLILFGCATTDKSEVTQAVEEIAARNLGFQIAKNDIELAGKILTYMDGMVGMDDNMLLTATEMGIGYLIDRIEDDPGAAAMMREDAMTLVKLFGLDPGRVDLQGVDVGRVRPVLSAFRRGVEIGM